MFVLTQTCHTLSNTCWVAYCLLCRVSRRWCSPSTFHVMAPVLLSETQENIVCCTIGQDCSTTEHHNYECYALVHVHVFFLRAAALNVQIRMEDGMDEIQIYSLIRWTAGCRHCRTRSKLCMTSCCSTIGT